MTKITTPFPLGREVNHDPRSLAYPAATPDVPLKTKSWRRFGAILDQGETNSCTGHAMAHWLNSNPRTPRTPLEKEADAMAIYQRATQIDPWPGEYPAQDTGSSGLAVAKAAQERGLITSYTHAFGLDHTLAALMAGPAMVGTNWYESMFWPDANGFLNISGSPVGGHEYLISGVDVKKRHVIITNSWGKKWGKSGRAYLSFDNLARLLGEEGDVTVPVR